MANKNDQIHLKIRKEDKHDMAEAAERLDITVSQFVREAVREKLATFRQAQNGTPAVRAVDEGLNGGAAA